MHVRSIMYILLVTSISFSQQSMQAALGRLGVTASLGLAAYVGEKYHGALSQCATLAGSLLGKGGVSEGAVSSIVGKAVEGGTKTVADVVTSTSNQASKIVIEQVHKTGMGLGTWVALVGAAGLAYAWYSSGNLAKHIDKTKDVLLSAITDSEGRVKAHVTDLYNKLNGIVVTTAEKTQMLVAQGFTKVGQQIGLLSDEVKDIKQFIGSLETKLTQVGKELRTKLDDQKEDLKAQNRGLNNLSNKVGNLDTKVDDISNMIDMMLRLLQNDPASSLHIEKSHCSTDPLQKTIGGSTSSPLPKKTSWLVGIPSVFNKGRS